MSDIKERLRVLIEATPTLPVHGIAIFDSQRNMLIECADHIATLEASVAANQKDKELLDFLETHRIGIYTCVNIIRVPTTMDSPRYIDHPEFIGWSAENMADEFPTIREAIQAVKKRKDDKFEEYLKVSQELESLCPTSTQEKS